MREINIYCDESCHFNSRSPIDNFMGIGGVFSETKIVARHSREIRKIKKKHNFNDELKWSKFYSRKINFYKELIDYFFEAPDLNFRIILINKMELDHDKYRNTHEDFYYITIYNLLHFYIAHDAAYNFYIDKKDTNTSIRIHKTIEYVTKKLRKIYKIKEHTFFYKVRCILSNESELLQLTDFFTGLITYYAKFKDSKEIGPFKKEIIEHLEKQVGNISLTETGPLGYRKFNILRFPPRGMVK